LHIKRNTIRVENTIHKSQQRMKQQQQQQSKHQFGRKNFNRILLLLSFSSFFVSLHPLLANAKTPNKKSLSSSTSSPTLEDALDQIDLAVQASSVQAWDDASDLVFDEILNESNLSQLFAKVAADTTTTSQEDTTEKKILEYIQSMREILSPGNRNGKLSTEDAMAIMRYGTNARTALKEYMD